MISRLLRAAWPTPTFADRITQEARKSWVNPEPVDSYQDEIGVHKFAGRDWCGDYAAVCALRAGIDPRIARHVLPSTYRLASHEFSDPSTGWAQVTGIDPPDRVPVGDVQPGDVITVRTGRNKDYGDHIAIVYDVLHDQAYTYEGNASGLLPDGSHSTSRRAPVRQVRALKDIRRVYRFDPTHTQK